MRERKDQTLPYAFHKADRSHESQPPTRAQRTILWWDSEEIKANSALQFFMARLEEEIFNVLLSQTSVSNLIFEESSVSSPSSRAETGEGSTGDGYVTKEDDVTEKDGDSSSRLTRRRKSYRFTSRGTKPWCTYIYRNVTLTSLHTERDYFLLQTHERKIAKLWNRGPSLA
ncbi:hypothetical protein YC2023_123392 [Brassica napus]